MRILHPWRGVWLLDLDLDPDVVALAPSSGKVTVTVTIGAAPVGTLSGTIDPRGSGSFIEFRQLRVLGGGAGWDQVVKPQHFHSDGLLRDVDVYTTTGVTVGEVVNVPIPSPLASDFVRSAGPASQIFAGLDWWVDLMGVTQVASRLPAVPDATLELMTWDPTTEVAELACQGLVLPGTPISDPRIPNGPVIVRDVEQIFDADGSRVTAWCGVSPVGQFMNDLKSLVTEMSGRRFLETYLYRIALQNQDGRLQLQAVHRTDGVPDLVPLAPWTGVAGASVKYKLGTLVRVAFLRGDPSQPLVDLYGPGDPPLETTVDATVAVHIGPDAVAVDLAGGETALVPAPWAADLATALIAFADALNLAAVGPLAPLGAVSAALQTALGALPPGATTKTTAT